MRIALTCPKCNSGVSVHEHAAGTTVYCPRCRHALPVPDARTPEPRTEPPTDPEDSEPYEPPVRRRRRRWNPLMVAFVGFFILGAAAGFAALAWTIHQSGRAEKARAAEQAKADASQPKADKSQPKGENPKPTAKGPERSNPPPAPKPPAPKSREELFADAWDAAWKASEMLDAEEPEKTEKALKLLTGREQSEVAFARQDAGLLYANAVRLTNLGLVAWVARASRKAAKADPEFKATAEALWEPSTGARGLLEMMNVWGVISPFTRLAVVDAVRLKIRTAGLTPEVRDAILLLGGRKWLER